MEIVGSAIAMTMNAPGMTSSMPAEH